MCQECDNFKFGILRPSLGFVKISLAKVIRFFFKVYKINDLTKT